jgi:preprotein translocase subunit YajC
MNAAHAAELAYASSGPLQAPGGPLGTLWSLLPFIAMFVIFYFLLFRPQQKQKHDRERMLRSLKRGDRVVMTSGLHGTITGLGEHTVTLRVADQVKLEFDRAAIGRVVEDQAEKDA